MQTFVLTNAALVLLTPILGNHVQPINQKEGNRGETKHKHLLDEEEYLTLLERVLLKGCFAEAAAAVFLAAALTSETPVFR